MKMTFPERSGMSFAGVKDTLVVVRRPYSMVKWSYSSWLWSWNWKGMKLERSVVDILPRYL